MENTHAADINEILMAYFLNGERWEDDWKSQVGSKKKFLTPEQQAAQYTRAKAMAAACKDVLTEPIERVFWVARPGALSRAMEMPSLDSKRNPTDVLVKLDSGNFIGFSAKSTNKKTGIALKNPGMSSIGGDLGIDLQGITADHAARLCEMYSLPKVADKRKAAIRVHPQADEIRAYGDTVLKLVRDMWYDKLNELSNEQLRSHLTRFWLDIDPVPPYWRVVGSGSGVRIENPYDSPVMDALNSEPIILDKGGSTIIQVTAGDHKVLKMRVKFESEKLASNLKFSGEA